MPPSRSYIVWFSQRVGSTVLTQTLEDTGIAGRPREWLNDASGDGLLAAYGVDDARRLREEIWRRGTTDNGVFGVKYSMRADLHRDVAALLGDWDAFFPRCKHVLMTRRDKLGLAVSWWRAIKSEEWHRPIRVEPTVVDGPAGRAPPKIAPPNLVELYDRDAITHLIAEAGEREADIAAELDRRGVVPYTIVYEDLIAQYDRTVRDLLDFLEIPGREDVVVAAPAFAKMADEISDAWCARYRSEK